MSQYAQNTGVGIDRTKAEIEKTLIRYGADQFGYGWDAERAFITFRIQQRVVKILLPLPALSDFRLTPTGKGRTAATQKDAHEQACRQRWRALLLIIKAKLEAVECKISTIEREFLADVVLPGGRTFGEWAAPQLEQICIEGKTPPLLLAA